MTVVAVFAAIAMAAGAACALDGAVKMTVKEGVGVPYGRERHDPVLVQERLGGQERVRGPLRGKMAGLL